MFIQCTRAESPIAGAWEARANDLPAVKLVIADNKGALRGNVIFYFQQKNGDGWKVVRENSEPLMEPQFAGQQLSFLISHKDAHPGASGPKDPPVRFEMRLTGPDEGILRSTNYGVSTETKMFRAK